MPAEAAEQLEQLEQLAVAVQQPAIERALAQIYLGTGLNQLAQERYLRALDRSTQVGDLEGQAIAHLALGKIARTLGDLAAAAEHLQQAQALYRRIGDSYTAGEITTLIPRS